MNKNVSIILEVILIIILVSLLTVMILPKLFRTSQNSEVETFVAEIQKIFRASKFQQSKINKDVIYNNAIGASTKNNSCNNISNLKLKDKNIVYTISLDYYGKITNLAVSNDEYEYIYKGEDLQLKDIKESEVKNIKYTSSEISLSLCE